MALKDIRKNYGKLLTAFNKAGAQLNESQKAAADTFIMGIENEVNNRVASTARLTKKLVQEKLDKQYTKAIAVLMENIERNQKLQSLVQKRQVMESAKKEMAEKVDGYLKLYVESSLPKKTIVNYDKLRKCETLIESLKDTLMVSDESVEAKKQQLQESYDAKKREMETKMALMQAKLNESMSKSQKLVKKIDSLKAVELLESKTKDLTLTEARSIKKRFAKASVAEIEKNFKTVLESIREDEMEKNKEEDMALESQINGILDSEDMKENDMLRNKPHNAHFSITENEEVEDGEEEEEDKKELTETDKPQTDEYAEECGDDVYEKELCESSSVITESAMAGWLAMLERQSK